MRKYKHFAWIVLGLSLLLVGCGAERKGDRIALIAELPNTAEYTINGVFVDIGIVYNVFEVEDVSLYNFNKRWCLFNGNSYWVMDKARLDEIAEKAGITLQSNMALPFWDEWGDRIIVIVVIIGFIILLKIQPKLKMLKPFNASLNKHNAANLVFHKSYEIKEYNGLKVRWSAFFAKAFSILLPPGDCTLVFDLKEDHGSDVTERASNHSAKSRIEVGKKYLLKSFKNDLGGNNIMSTYIVEFNENELNDYVSGYAIERASLRVERVGVNITPDKAQNFVNEFAQQMKNKDYHFVDERSGNAVALYYEFCKFPVSILDGEVYTYKKGVDWLLLISRGELGIMWSFSKDKK